MKIIGGVDDYEICHNLRFLGFLGRCPRNYF